jgi:ABC-type transporter Mla MlaB component
MSTHLTLPAELTIYTAASTCAAWLNALAAAGEGPLQAQASAVAEVDGAGLQLLVSLRHTLAAAQRTLQFVEPSETLLAACRATGLVTLLSTENPA